MERIKQSLLAEFGALPLNAKRGPFEAWFRDQQMMSIKLHRWLKRAKADCRRTDLKGERVRWDRANWPNFNTTDKWLNGTDAHLPLPGHIEDHFKAVHQLAQIIAGDALNVTLYWHTYMTRMGAKVSSLEKFSSDVSKPMTGNLHKPEIDG